MGVTVVLSLKDLEAIVPALSLRVAHIENSRDARASDITDCLQLRSRLYSLLTSHILREEDVYDPTMDTTFRSESEIRNEELAEMGREEFVRDILNGEYGEERRLAEIAKHEKGR